jgi:hypothetical protein
MRGNTRTEIFFDDGGIVVIYHVRVVDERRKSDRLGD